LIITVERCSGQVNENAVMAFHSASELDKTILLVFAGSDWCAGCIRFEKDILSKPEFQEFAREKLIVLKADFPQRRKLTPGVREQNAQLAERYNPNGIFPYVLLLNAEETIITSLLYDNQSSTQFIEEIKHYLP
jgi:thiamine biosynthesis lipoprotein